MKPPVNIDDLMELWSQDSRIDESEPSRELARIPILHSKYLRILTHHSLFVKKLMSDHAKMKRIKWEWYTGDLNNIDDLKTYNLEPWAKKILRQDIPIYIDSDNDLNNILMKKVIHQEIVDFCASVLKELNNRTFQLNNIIKWEVYTRGG
jgi:hypothetical protein